MAKWASTDLHDTGLAGMKNGATKLVLVKNYTAGDSFATVTANKLAEASLTAADMVLSSSGNTRVLTSAAKAGNVATASSVQGDNLHFVFTDSTKVWYATDETTDQVVTSGNPQNFPSLTLTFGQPT